MDFDTFSYFNEKIHPNENIFAMTRYEKEKQQNKP